VSVQAVQQAKDECLALGIDITGPCGALEITNRAAVRNGWKLVEKTTGENCRQRKTDGLIVDGQFVDCLVNAGGVQINGEYVPNSGNVPAWQVMGPQGSLVAVDPFPLEDGEETPQPGLEEKIDTLLWLGSITYNQAVLNGRDLVLIKEKLGI
jgi:hypothetical protein